MATPTTIRLAAVADVHCRLDRAGVLAPLFERAAEDADILALCGDLTDYGTLEEARQLAEELAAAKGVPMVGVLGNHDFESGSADGVRNILRHAGLQLLDGETCNILGIGFAGVKGFAGGYGRSMLRPWGEAAIKAFACEAVEEAEKLERALAELETAQRVVLMHYSPIEGTIEGEPREIYPYLGTSRLEAAVHSHPVSMVIHGHAHFGRPAAETSHHVPVYNVAMPLLQALAPQQPPFRVFELPVMP
jgi:Icc-related predicted phosphoesterase